MNLLDLLNNVAPYVAAPDEEVNGNDIRKLYNDTEIVVNVTGFLLPIENVKIRDDKIILVIGTSSFEDRQI